MGELQNNRSLDEPQLATALAAAVRVMPPNSSDHEAVMTFIGDALRTGNLDALWDTFKTKLSLSASAQEINRRAASLSALEVVTDNKYMLMRAASQHNEDLYLWEFHQRSLRAAQEGLEPESAPSLRQRILNKLFPKKPDTNQKNSNNR